MIGSVAVHAVLVWVIAAADRDGAPSGTKPTSASITIVDVVEFDLLPTEEPPARESGGAGDPSTPAHAARAARTTTTATRSRPTGVEDPRGAITIDHADPRGELASDGHDESGAVANGALAFDGRGMGLGRGGSGRGMGVGFGDGGAIQRIEKLSPPPAPKASLARPARLIYPTRQRAVEDAELFIARVIVDDEGYVVGAKLVRGFGGRRDEVASQMIWKFRYDPARDDDGRVRRSTLDQRFLVGP